jgi:hypothetical protein
MRRPAISRGEAEVVALRVEAEEREVEAVLPAGRAVAGAGVAAGGGEHRHHVELERNRAGFFRVLDGDRDFGAEPAVFDAQGGGAVLRGERWLPASLASRGIVERVRRTWRVMSWVDASLKRAMTMTRWKSAAVPG